jgi:hypothetical protein
MENKFKNGDQVRIIQSGIVGKVVDHREDRDDNVTTLVEYVNANKGVHRQWCRETELGSTSASDDTKASEKATGVGADPIKVVGTDPKITNDTKAEHDRMAERGHGDAVREVRDGRDVRDVRDVRKTG